MMPLDHLQAHPVRRVPVDPGVIAPCLALMPIKNSCSLNNCRYNRSNASRTGTCGPWAADMSD